MWIDDFLGKRYEFNRDLTINRLALPDITIVGFHPDKGIRVHAADGGRWWFTTKYVKQAIKVGLLVESSRSPFVFDKNEVVSKRRYVALMSQPVVNEKYVARLQSVIAAMHDETKKKRKDVRKKR